jgi:hypothetical protein
MIDRDDRELNCDGLPWLCDRHVTYLTNACGEWTWHRTTLPKSEIKQAAERIAFGDGPGFVLPYLAEVDGKACWVSRVRMR